MSRFLILFCGVLLAIAPFQGVNAAKKNEKELEQEAMKKEKSESKISAGDAIDVVGGIAAGLLGAFGTKKKKHREPKTAEPIYTTPMQPMQQTMPSINMQQQVIQQAPPAPALGTMPALGAAPLLGGIPATVALDKTAEIAKVKTAQQIFIDKFNTSKKEVWVAADNLVVEDRPDSCKVVLSTDFQTDFPLYSCQLEMFVKNKDYLRDLTQYGENLKQAIDAAKKSGATDQEMGIDTANISNFIQKHLDEIKQWGKYENFKNREKTEGLGFGAAIGA